ncbi:Ger(x)C family spore germination protein [Gracilibacillus salitolerans]|uniref:Ger(X)C family spore germination protein n=1 Tax=Gracilibacillus salitolerans TaxID=2663022 RepID=A0A5Q2TQS7_9BACI|nr:Ger(x)C family spore germination protein [Gracilibacillus salitolerans]QGH36437.1 Ger(x)C family spore germination protein [Gracilibacillus salitolerans]
MKIIRLVLLFICIVLLSGCWDKKELNEVAVVIGVGIDKVSDKEDVYEITAQVIKPLTEDQGSELPTWSITAQGETVMSAIKNMNRLSPRRLYWSHLQIIIFGEELAREGVAPIITWFERDRDSRAGSYLVVTRGSAQDLLNQKIELGSIPSKAMSDLLDTAEQRQIIARKVKLRDFTTVLTTPGIDASADVIHPKTIRGEVESYEVREVAVFKEDKVVGYIDRPELAGTELLKDTYDYFILEGACPGDEEELFAFQTTSYESEDELNFENEEVTYKVNIFLEGNLSDQTCSIDLLERDKLEQVEEKLSEIITTHIENEFELAKEMGSDIYGIGQKLRRSYPDAWKKVKNQPDELLAKVKFDIQVTSNIRRSGLIIEPTQTKIE